MWFSFHLLHISLNLIFVTCLAENLGEVVFLNLLFRHGDRTPIELYPNDPYKNSTLWSVGWGELTDVGKNGHYKLGKWLRKRYHELLPRKYDRKDIYIRSTDVDRTLMSAYSNLAGLYEPDLETNWNQNIKWTPIPVHTVPEYLDGILAAKAPCPKYNTELKKLTNSFEFKKIDEENEPLYKYLTIHTGTNITNVVDVERIYDSLFIEELNKLRLPNWTKNVYPQPMKKISEFTFTIPCYTPLLARLKVGPLLGEILKHMERKVSNETNLSQKVVMYSAHDTTVANVLKALDIFDSQCPPYYSLILFELRKKNDKYYVAVSKLYFKKFWDEKIHYRNSSSVPPYFMQLKGCEKLCPYDKFKAIVSSLVPKDWNEECKVIRFAENIFDTAASISFITIVSLAFIFLISFGIVVKFFKNPQRNQNEFAYKSLKLEIAS